ncbi:hypothetical protein HPB50_011178 [Hyalomma asiaticum]|uniref:Uncharacterized protein n=1 Tax=Hyalomma asiaticum TaxID=266040 RepID=A0ACB7RNW0_HYAAI|nr:hypothetical protein HPB50_011178 [Hyalomma asiaticum]
MAKHTRKTTGHGDLVQCEECKRWCYIDETSFASLADAQKASFTYRLCVGLREAVQRMEREWARSVEELGGELRMERERRTELQAQVGEALLREKANADLLERMMRELKEERERRTELEERVKVLIAPDTDSERCETKEKGGAESQADTGRDKKGHPEASVEKGGLLTARRPREATAK